jgi:glutamine synthetase
MFVDQVDGLRAKGGSMFSDLKDLLNYVKKNEIQMLDFKVVDLTGRWRHITYSTRHLNEGIFEEGTGISLSPYPGYRRIEQGDMKIVPDLTTAFVDPFFEVPTLSFLTDILTKDGMSYIRDPRKVAKRAEEYLKKLEIGESFWSPELEFYIFDLVRYGTTEHGSFFDIDSQEGVWQGHEKGIAGGQGYYPPRAASGQCDMPRDHLVDVRTKMVQLIENAGIPVKYHHHEVGGPGQAEIEVFFNTLLKTADHMMIMKYVIKNAAIKEGLTATFMPKPLYGEAGNGIHYHQYLAKNERSLFYNKNGYAGMSNLALNYAGGLLANTPSLMGITNASTNSYLRFGLGLAAPRYLTFSESNRSSALRIPGYAINEKEARIEYRLPDATGNPYLTLAGMLMAGLRGIKKKTDPEKNGFGPYDVNIYALPEPERKKLKVLPNSFSEALNYLKSDHKFLVEGNVFSEELIEAYIQMKFEKEIDVIAERPHPYEYELYYDL